VPETNVVSGTNYTIPLSVEGKKEIISFDMNLKFDPEILEFKGILKTNELTDFEVYTNYTANGIIRIGGFSLSPQEISGNYLTLNFEVVGNPGQSGEVELKNYTFNNEPGFFASTNVTIENTVVSSIPLKYNLSQNYPNPFNPSTTIRYEIPKISYVTITVFNLLGEKIRTLVDTEKQAGRYSVLWNGENEAGRKVPSGLYFYQLQSGEFSWTHKMLLTK